MVPPVLHVSKRRHTRTVMTYRRARRRATSAEDTLVHAVELLSILLRLQEFSLRGWVVVLQERLDRLVLLVKVGEVRNEVFDNVHCKSALVRGSGKTQRTVRKGVDFRGFGVLGDSTETSQSVDTVNVHRT